MRIFRRVTIGMVLAGVAVPSVAAEMDRAHLTQCKHELKRVYGEDSRLKLKSIKRGSDGTRMRIKAIPSVGESQVVTCRIDGNGMANMVDGDGLALVTPAFEATDMVSFND